MPVYKSESARKSDIHGEMKTSTCLALWLSFSSDLGVLNMDSAS